MMMSSEQQKPSSKYVTADDTLTGEGEMHALVWRGKHDIKLEKVPKPRIVHPQDVLVKVTSTTICGSDLHFYNDELPEMHSGDVIGHECMGTVEETGSEVKNLKVGQRVVVAFNIACGSCTFCEREQFSACRSTNPSETLTKMLGDKPSGVFGYTHMTGGWPGCQAEWVRVPYGEVNCLPIPEDLPDIKALFLSDVVTTAYHAVFDQAQVQQGDVVGIWGMGPIGLMAARWAQIAGASRVFCISGTKERNDLAAQMLEVETLNYHDVNVLNELKRMVPKGLDCAIDCTGFRFTKSTVHAVQRALMMEKDSPEVLQEVCMAVRQYGRISLIADYAGWCNAFPIGAIHMKHLTVNGGQSPTQKNWKKCLEYIKNGTLNPEFIVTHSPSLAEGSRAYELMHKRDHGMIKPFISLLGGPFYGDSLPVPGVVEEAKSGEKAGFIKETLMGLTAGIKSATGLGAKKETTQETDNLDTTETTEQGPTIKEKLVNLKDNIAASTGLKETDTLDTTETTEQGPTTKEKLVNLKDNIVASTGLGATKETDNLDTTETTEQGPTIKEKLVNLKDNVVAATGLGEKKETTEETENLDTTSVNTTETTETTETEGPTIKDRLVNLKEGIKNATGLGTNKDTDTTETRDKPTLTERLVNLKDGFLSATGLKKKNTEETDDTSGDAELANVPVENDVKEESTGVKKTEMDLHDNKPVTEMDTMPVNETNTEMMNTDTQPKMDTGLNEAHTQIDNNVNKTEIDNSHPQTDVSTRFSPMASETSTSSFDPLGNTTQKDTDVKPFSPPQGVRTGVFSPTERDTGLFAVNRVGTQPMMDTRGTIDSFSDTQNSGFSKPLGTNTADTGFNTFSPSQKDTNTQLGTGTTSASATKPFSPVQSNTDLARDKELNEGFRTTERQKTKQIPKTERASGGVEWTA